MGFEVINLGGDRPAKLSHVIDLVAQAAGRPAELVYGPMHPADVPATWADITKAERLLGWRPQVTLEEGVARLARLVPREPGVGQYGRHRGVGGRDVWVRRRAVPEKTASVRP